jgi:hypothetical protein
MSAISSYTVFMNATAQELAPLRWELLSREKGFRKWRVFHRSGSFYVVICKAWGEERCSWYISPNGDRWADVSREELRSYLDSL